MAEASEPPLASVMATAARPPAAMRGRNRCFCSGVPNCTTGPMAWNVVAQVMAVAGQAREIASTSCRYPRYEIGVPPYSSGMNTPFRPRLLRSFTFSQGNSSDWSYSSARGAIFSAATLRTCSTNSASVSSSGVSWSRRSKRAVTGVVLGLRRS